MSDLEATSARLRDVDRLRSTLRLLQPFTSRNQRRCRWISSRSPSCGRRSSGCFIIRRLSERNGTGKLD
ncbi:hypothetical protein IC582_029772 [Cucumis melo]